TVVAGMIFGLFFIFAICIDLTSASAKKRQRTANTAPGRARFNRKKNNASSANNAAAMLMVSIMKIIMVGEKKIRKVYSGISHLGSIFEQQTPEPPRHFQLSLAPFRCGHLLGSQHIEHQHSARDGEN